MEFFLPTSCQILRRGCSNIFGGDEDIHMVGMKFRIVQRAEGRRPRVPEMFQWRNRRILDLLQIEQSSEFFQISNAGRRLSAATTSTMKAKANANADTVAASFSPSRRRTITPRFPQPSFLLSPSAFLFSIMNLHSLVDFNDSIHLTDFQLSSHRN